MSRSQGTLLAVLVLVIVAVVVTGRWFLTGNTPGSSAQEDRLAPGSPVSVVPSTGVVSSAASLPREDVPLPPMAEGAPVDAVESLQRAREAGDARAPAVVRSPDREAPTAAELADPDAYQRYESRQNERLYRSYVKSAESEIPKLQDQIARGRQGGLTPEQVAEGEEKLRRIEAMRNQLMSDHPELNKPPPAGE